MWLIKYYIKFQARKSTLSETESENLFKKIFIKFKLEEKNEPRLY